MLAAPVLAGNLLAPDYKQSLAFLLVGFALSEMWRAPAAIMIRDVSPPNLGSTGSALHLCVRNFTGSLGPLGAQLSPDTLLCMLKDSNSLWRLCRGPPLLTIGLCPDTKTSIVGRRWLVKEPVYSLTLTQPARQLLRLANA